MRPDNLIVVPQSIKTARKHMSIGKVVNNCVTLTRTSIEKSLTLICQAFAADIVMFSSCYCKTLSIGISNSSD